MQTSDSMLSFTITPPIVSGVGSSLTIATTSEMYTSLSFSNTNSCLVNNIPQPCTVSTNSTYTSITISSSTSSNLFPFNIATNITINNLLFKSSSSHTYHIYHYYFSFTASNLVGALTKYCL
jgi:uncharacterized protein (UPF0333 family)